MPYQVIDNVVIDNAETAMGIIQMNVLMLQGAYKILCYSSVEQEELDNSTLENHSFRRN